MEGIYSFLQVLLIFWLCFSLILTPLAIYLNVKKEAASDPLKKKHYRIWGWVCIIFGPVCLLFLVPLLAYLRIFILGLSM
jgi:hypothetical protein